MEKSTNPKAMISNPTWVMTLGPMRSMSHPCIGPTMPPSSCIIENEPDRSERLQPNSPWSRTK